LRYKKLSTALTALATAVVVTVTGQPAQAAAAYISQPLNLCFDPGYACAWYGQYGNDGAVGFYNDAWDWGAIPAQFRGINNNSSSWESHGTSTYGNVRFFANAGGGGANKCLKKGYSQDTSDGMDNIVSANVWVSSCTGYTQFSNQHRIW
jgi:hypothetical protein